MIAIIGAGPVGNYLSYLLSKKKEVNVFEEHSKIGLPVQCTGITTSLLKNIIKLKKDVVVNEIKKGRIYSPNKKFIEIDFKEKNIIVDRYKFDNQIADMAKQNGVKFFLNHKFIGNKNNIALIKDKKNNTIKKIKYESLVGADGPLSSVAKSNNMFGRREFWNGMQARVRLKNENIVEFYPFFGTYAWVVPENKDIARVGIASTKDLKTLFRNFLFKFKNIKEKDIIEYQSGIIPKYNPRAKTQNNNVYLIGDSASQVKATTGGGIIQGLSAAKSLSHSILKNKNYEKEWRKLIGKELYIHLITRKIMDKFNEKDWNKLVSGIDKSILENNDRDNISIIALKMLLKKPSLLYFTKYLF